MSEIPVSAVPSSPSTLQLRGAPRTSARLSKKAALVVVVALASILGVIVMNVSKPHRAKSAAEDSLQRDLIPAAEHAAVLEKEVPELTPAVLPSPRPSRSLPPTTPASPGSSFDSDEAARLASTEIPKFTGSIANITSTASDSAAMARRRHLAANLSETDAVLRSEASDSGISTNTAGVYPAPLRRMAGTLGTGGSATTDEVDPNHQDEKMAFKDAAHHSFELTSRLAPLRSPFEIETGTVIPGILIDALNSDLPGEIVAQVSQNVYDTATGSYLLIPQGSRLFGRYDSRVSYGQDRLMINWERLLFPNGATLDLGAMSGHDGQGDAGFTDQVDHHYARIFGWALTSALLSAGYQLSQPQQANTFTNPSSSQVIAASVGQQATTLGTQIAQRNLQIQPTVRIHRGYRMLVMVNKDIVLPGSYAVGSDGR